LVDRLGGVLEGLLRVLVGLFGEFVSGKVVAFAMGGGCGLVSVRCLVVELCGSVVDTLRHDVFLLDGLKWFDAWVGLAVVRLGKEELVHEHK
jgi:hypothetical protein